jgi:uncharacterized protein YrzB (UPF0473 family)
MEKKDNKIVFTDDQGKITELNILFTYKSEERNKMYVLFYADENPTEIIAGYLGENDEIYDIEDDDEYDELEEVLKSYQEEKEN